MGGHGEGVSLEFTPTWVVAGVCTIIVAISLAVERLLHHFGTVLKKKKQKPLYEALQKVKEGTKNPIFTSSLWLVLLRNSDFIMTELMYF